MMKKKTIEQEYLECDGCGYVMGKEDPRIEVSVPFDFPWEWLRDLKDPGVLTFHFHALRQRHDCFRYWAHNPRIMEQSLKDRELDNEQREEFLSLMLYRAEGNLYSPGIPRENQ